MTHRRKREGLEGPLEAVLEVANEVGFRSALNHQ
jgi:hypothetical protein